LFFSSAREGLLPPRLARVDPASRAPRAAIATALTVMSVVWLAHTLGLVSLSLILRLPGQNFLVLYGLSVAAYVVLVRSTAQRLLGVLAGLLVLLTAATFGPGLLYSAALMLVGGLLSRLRVARRARSATR
ncbi:MAG TPA: hypothetical protein VE547_19925, partial [Mycobacteriales bacterium]|nr:hypothetical protein [Mycobacteriales bacterium]